MKNRINHIAVAFLILAIIAGCNTTKNSSYLKKDNREGKNSALTTILQPEINSPDAKELARTVYNDQSYYILQDEGSKFKDNAPFIEYLDGGKRERLWFASSRADDVFFGHKRTNNYQQIYYCEREVGNGVAPNEGWGKINILKIETDNPYLKEVTDIFNKSTKGAIAIVDNTMIFSSDLISDKGNSEFKNLWEMKREGDIFKNPKPIIELSNENTWESQPTLSSNGKHLFFVSNRKIEADGTINNNEAVNEMNIFYSFYENGKWRTPVLVNELYSAKNEVTPHILYNNSKIYFASDKDGDYQIYEAPLLLNDEKGGYQIEKSKIELFSNKTFDLFSGNTKEIEVNGVSDQNYPFIYYNPMNKKAPRSIFWASNQKEGFGSYDIYGCAMPFNVTMNVTIADVYPTNNNSEIEYPVLSLEGYQGETVYKSTTSFQLYSGLNYQLKGGSTASPEKGTYYCDADQNYIFIGYSKIVNNQPADKSLHSSLLQGPEVNSGLTEAFGSIPLYGILSDTIMTDTVCITRAWQKKPPCPGKLNIEPTYRSISYFQTGYWEVNTSENLKRDLEKLHEGFEFTQSGDIYNPTGRITRTRSDYKVTGYDDPIFPIKTNDRYTYSIANAPWIELHPNNQYWGDRPGMESRMEQRMKGRKDRINQYAEYAKKVDENLKNLTDTIKTKYIHLLDLHKDMKPQLLIEIFAVSDQREVSRSWYIGETVEYRGTEYDENLKQFKTDLVKIVAPTIDETTKTITQIKPCTIEFNKDGDNGSILGISSEKSDQNTNLSRLRAWYGYKEVLKRLSDSENFNKYLKAGKVALPDNNVSYEDADIIIITRGKREDGDVENPKYPYPQANNPSGNGYFDYDGIRHIEIQTRLLINKEKNVEENFCCSPEK